MPVLSARSARLGQLPRPAYDAAFGDRIPPQVLNSARRGRQGADWFEMFPQDEVADLFGHYSRNNIIRELFDLDFIGRQVAGWPTAIAASGAGMIQYQNEVLGALAVADFIDLHFPD